MPDFIPFTMGDLRWAWTSLWAEGSNIQHPSTATAAADFRRCTRLSGWFNRCEMKKWLILIVVAVGLLAIVFLAARRNAAEHPVVHLPSGFDMVLLGQTFGTNHVWVDAPVWQKLLLKLPRGLTARLPLPAQASFTSSKEGLMIWTRITGATGFSGSPPEISVEDENDICSGATGGNTTGTGWGGTNMLLGFRLDTFPRRSKTFTIHVFAYGSQYTRAEVGSFKINNPLHGKTFAEWKPEPLPQTKTNGDIEVTLKRLVANVRFNAASEPEAVTNKWDSATHIESVVKHNGKELKNWHIEYVNCLDATGNDGSQTKSSGAGEVMLINSLLWPDEPAWKLRLELSRTSGFHTNELASFKAVPVTAYSSTPTVLYTTNIQHFKVEVLGVNGNAPEQPEGEHRSYVFRFRTTPPLDGYRFTVTKAVDENGNKLAQVGWGQSGTSSSSDNQVSLDSTNTATALDITLAIHQSRFVEFIAKPEVLRAAKAK